MIDGTFVLLVALLGGLGILAYRMGGTEEVVTGLRSGADLLLRFTPILVISFLAAGFAERLIPQEWVREQLGADSGLRGLVLATGAGMLTPAGPFVSMPIAAVMIRSGAGSGPIVAFLAAWALLAVHRLVAWEVPILGWNFALLRYAPCLVLPILAGLAARTFAR